MSLTVQNLRAVGPGVEPASLLPGQICFNVTDKVLFTGDGSDFKSSFDGTVVPGVPGAGWFSTPLDFSQFSDNFIVNPEVYGDIPTDGQVLTWDSTLGHTTWTNGGSTSNIVYATTNANVAAAPGATLTAKINTAIGVASPDPNDWVVVTGLPGDVFQGLYYFDTAWEKAANYAFPTGAQVPYSNTVSGLTANDVQEAIDELDTLTAAAQGTADAAFAAAGIAQDAADAAQADATQALADAAAAQSTADAALPRSGGTMTGTLNTLTLNTQQVNVGSGYGVTFASGANGTIFGISGVVNSTSTTTAASLAGVNTAYNAAVAAQATADAAIPRASYTANGQILLGTGAGTFSPLNAGAEGYILTIVGGVPAWASDAPGDVTSVTGVAPIVVDNLDPQNPVVSVDLATTATPGVVQVELTGNLTLVGGVIDVPDASTTVKGAVQLNNTLSSTSTTEALTAAQGAILQGQIDTLTLSNSVTLAGGYNASTGVVVGATSQGQSVGFTDGNAPPAASATTVDYYLIATTAGNIPSAMSNGDWLLSTETSPGVYAYQVLGVGARPQQATYLQAGIVQLANGAAVLAGTSDSTAITPKALQDNIIDSVTTVNSSQMASATAVNTAYVAATNAQTTANSALATANAALPRTGGIMTGNITFQDAGEGIAFNGGSQLFAISSSTSTTSATTAASSTAVKAAYDIGAAAIPCAVVSSLGDIISTNGSGVPTALPLGLNGQVLIVNTACATGLEWVSDTPGDVTSVTGTAPIAVDNTDPQNPVVSIDAATLVSCGAVQLCDALNSSSDTVAATAGAVCTTYNLADLANTTANAAIPCAAFLAKGNLLGGIGTGAYSALTVGTNGQVLIADSACTTGLKWGNACYVPDACFTAAGQIIVGTGAGTYVALPVGTDCQTLVVNSACTATGGVTWGVSLTGYTCSVAVGNTALGEGAGDSITTGLHNTVIGSCAGTAISAGDNNTLVGWCTGDGLTSGNNNTVVGALAFGNTGGSNNTIMGYCSGAALTTGNSNTLIGSNAGDAIAGGNSIVGVGQGVLGGAVTAAGTVAIGATAGAALTSGASTTLVGFAAGDSITSGARNTVVGHTSGGAITTGADNTIIGALAGNLASGTGSTILGSCAGAALTLGGANVFLGAGAGDLVTTGFNNTIIGDVGGSTTLQGNAILAAGTTIKFQANSSGAWSYDGTNFGTAGQFLASQGSAATPVWCTLSLACIPCSVFTAAGQLIAGTGASTFTALNVGTDGQFLVADSTCTGGLKWATECFVNDASFTAKGDILVGTAANAFSALTLGTSGQALVVDSACASGVKWTTASGLNLAGFTCSATPFNTALGANAGAAFTVNSVANTAIGYNALDSETSGDFNVAVGHNTLCSQNGGSCNIAIGANAGSSITTGGTNVVIGHNTGDSLTSGSANTFIGFGAGQATTGGTDHVAIGYGAMGNYTGNTAGMVAIGLNALCSLTSGLCNTAVGYNAANALTTGGCNIAIGARALDSTIGGAANVAIGVDALTANTSGDFNTAVGHIAADAITTGANNVSIGYSAHGSSNPAQQVAVGKSALQSSSSTGSVGVGFEAALNSSTGLVTAVGYCALRGGTTGTCNTAVGYNAGAAYTGSNSTFIGHGAGDVATSGNSNTFVGANAGGAVTIGASNILIGDTAGDAITTGSSNTIIGDIAGSTTLANNLILAAGSTIKLQVNENGAVGVGATPSYGTAGQVLQSAGTAAAPTWTTPIWQPLTTLTTTSTTTTTLLSVPVASTRAVFIDLSVSDVTGGNYHTDSYQVVTDGTSTDDQQIAGARIGVNPYNLTSAVVGANLVISVTSATTNSTKYVGSYQTIAV